MIVSLLTSLTRVTCFWYVIGVLVMFIGDPKWAQVRYARLMTYPGVPVLELHGLATAAQVQINLVLFWTLPMLALWAIVLGVGYVMTEVRASIALRKQELALKPTGEFWGVRVASFSMGRLPMPTTPARLTTPVEFVPESKAKRGTLWVDFNNALGDVLKKMSENERLLAGELLQMLYAYPNHYTGPGHGVGLLEHTLNVTVEVAGRCTGEFRLPVLASLAHDIGKLITFRETEDGKWERRGLHSREGARILATLPAFQKLPEEHQRGLLLAVKYDHAPNAIPALRSEREPAALALRIINALAQADRSATAAEKDRNLVKLKPEDLLWQDFVDYLREAPVVQRGKKGAANQVNNPADSPYLYIYEAIWRDAAVKRLPEEVAAALDLTRRDAGKVAKYTAILVERLRSEGLLVESHEGMTTPPGTPLWDIQSGTGEKAVVMRGIIVLHAAALWRAVNYKVSTLSPFPVQIISPTADAGGKVKRAPEADRSMPGAPDVSDRMAVVDASANGAGAAGTPAGSTPPKSDPTSIIGAPGTITVSSPADIADLFAGPSKLKGRRVSHRQPAPRPSPGLTEAPAVKPVAAAATSAPAGASEAPPPAPATDAAPAAPAISSPLPTSAAAVAPPTPAVHTVKPTSEAASPVAPTDGAEEMDELEYEQAMLEESQAGEGAVVPEPVLSESPSTSSALALLAGMGALAPAAEEDDEDPADESAEGPVASEPEVLVRSVPEPAASATVDESRPVPAPVALSASVAAVAVADAVSLPRLSHSEQRAGVAIADAAAIALYPQLSLGDKYYTEASQDVKAGLREKGSRYEAGRGGKPSTGGAVRETPAQAAQAQQQNQQRAQAQRAQQQRANEVQPQVPREKPSVPPAQVAPPAAAQPAPAGAQGNIPTAGLGASGPRRPRRKM